MFGKALIILPGGNRFTSPATIVQLQTEKFHEQRRLLGLGNLAKVRLQSGSLAHLPVVFKAQTDPVQPFERGRGQFLVIGWQLAHAKAPRCRPR
jgi:hypothetical protein